MKNITATTRDARTMPLLLHKGVRRQCYMFSSCNIVPYLLLHVFVIPFLIAFVHVFVPISEVSYISADILRQILMYLTIHPCYTHTHTHTHTHISAFVGCIV